MSIGILNLQGGNIEQHMTGDIVTASEKNMENWNIVGEVDVEKVGTVNSITYENVPKTPAQALKEALQAGSGIPATDACINELLALWDQHTDMTFYYIEFSGLDIRCMLCNPNDYMDETGFHFSAGDYDLRMRTPGGTEMQGIASTSTMPNSGVYAANVIVKFAYIGTYDEIHNSSAFSGYVDKNFSVENGKKYMVMFECYSPSGFSASSNDNVVITSGSNSSDITIDGENTTEYAQYYQFINADSSTLNVKFDLSTMPNTLVDVELNITSIEIYKLNG